MKLLQRLLAIISYLFGLYYLYLLFISLATRWGLFFPLQELPLQVLVYLYYSLFVVMAGIATLKNDRYYLFAASFLVMVAWIIFLPLYFIPTVPILIMVIYFQRLDHPIKQRLPFLVIAYITLGFSPVLGYFLQVIGWGMLAQTLQRTKKRGF